MQEIVRRGKDSDVFIGLRLVNKHNGHLAIVSNSEVTDYGRISWSLTKEIESFSLTWSAEDIVRHWYLCTHEEYEQLLALSQELVGILYFGAEGVIPIKMGFMEVQDAVEEHPDDTDSVIFRWVYSYIKQDESYVDDAKPVVVSFRLKLNSDDGGATGHNINEYESGKSIQVAVGNGNIQIAGSGDVEGNDDEE